MSTKAQTNYADTVEDVEWILDADPRALASHIAARLGYSDKSGLQKALESRPDLLDRLARNAALAGHNVRNRKAAS